MKLMREGLAAIAAAALIPAAPAMAQTIEPALEVAPGNTVLTVSAEGTTQREPDLAIFSAGVTTEGPTAAEALSENSTAMNRVIAALRDGGVAERDIQTSNLSISPIYSEPDRDARAAGSGETQRRVIVGYRATNTVSIRQRDLENYGTVLDTLVRAGANQVNGPSFQLEDEQPALDEARLTAIRNAQARAELYANATGLRVVRILSITESGGYYRPSPVAFARAEAASAAPPPVQAGELTMNANVTVLYELAP